MKKVKQISKVIIISIIIAVFVLSYVDFGFLNRPTDPEPEEELITKQEINPRPPVQATPSETSTEKIYNPFE